MHKTSTPLRIALPLLGLFGILLAFLMGFSHPSVAQEATVPPCANAESGGCQDPGLPTWAGEAELGFVLTGGNTRTQSLNTKLKILHERLKWRYILRSEFLRSSDRGETKAQRFVISGRTAYKINVYDSIFVKGRYEDDRFSGYDWRITETISYARRIFNIPEGMLEISVGPGGRHSRLNDGTREDEVLGIGEIQLEYKLNGSSTFSEDVTVESGKKGTVTESVTALKSQLMSNLAMKLSFTVNHNTKVPLGTKKTNTHTAVTLVYGF